MRSNLLMLIVSLLILEAMIISSVLWWKFDPGFWILMYVFWGFSSYTFGKEVLRENY